nr:hypothetical protein [Tanacetum cinerariifolium]
MSESSKWVNDSCVLYDHVTNPFTAQQERKDRKDYGTRRGRHSTSSSSAFNQPSSSHLNDDDDDGNDRDITLSLSPIIFLDHILDTLSPPSPQPKPQPPLMGHPIYFNYHEYHGSTCLCCFCNRNLIFSLRDEMNLMFAYIEYLLTSTMTSLSPPHP